MITSFDKFIVAILGAIIYALSNFFGVVEIIGINLLDAEAVDSFIANAAVFITPLLVWLIPNKET